MRSNLGRATMGALITAFFGLILTLNAAPAPAEERVFDVARLEELLRSNPATNRPVDSVAELVPLLPRYMRMNFTFVYDSRSPFRSSISPDHPRVIMFTPDARLVLTFTTDPAQPGLDLLESLSFDDGTARFDLRSYLLPAAERRSWRPSEIATNCAGCHGADPRPIFDSYPLWPGFYGSVLDAFQNDRLGAEELQRYRIFLANAAKTEPFKSLIFPSGSTVSPYLDPKLTRAGTVELDTATMQFLPNTRLGMALTELNRERVYRKLSAGPNFRSGEKTALAELLDCQSAPSPAVATLQTIADQLQHENAMRLQRLGLQPGEARPDVDTMQELKFARELAEIDDVAKRIGVDRSDWSMALEPRSLSFFDGILSGIEGDKSYYLKEDLIAEMLAGLSKREPEFDRYFAMDWVFAEQGYPFGDRVDLKKALASCPLLTSAAVPGPSP